MIGEAGGPPTAGKARWGLGDLRAGAKPAPGKPGRRPPPVAPTRPPLAAPPAGETVFLVVERVASVDVAEVRAQYVATSGDTIVAPFVITNRGNAEDAVQLTST